MTRSALVEFPIVGDQLLRSLHPLQGSGIGLALGLIGLAWGGLGVTQIAQHAMAEIWNVPGVDRPGRPHRMTMTPPDGRTAPERGGPAVEADTFVSSTAGPLGGEPAGLGTGAQRAGPI